MPGSKYNNNNNINNNPDKTSLPIRIVRSRRKTLSMQVKAGELLIRAPLKCPDDEIRRFINEHSQWITRQIGRQEEALKKADEEGALTAEEIRALADKALAYIPQRVRYYAPKVGVDYGRITIRNQRSKWGSCSSKGNLNFNCLLMLTPPEVIDSVVVHELCHRLEMNHSQRFYENVLRVFPDYYKWDRWLKENGGILLKRMEAGLRALEKN